MSNYYTKTVADSTFATIASLSNYVTNSSLATTLSGYLPIGTPLNTIAAPNGSVDLAGNRITNVGVPTNAGDAANKSYVDGQVSGALVGSITMWPTTSAPSGYLICDGSTYSSGTYPALFAILGTTTLPDFRDKFARGFDSTTGRTILDVQQDAYENHLH